MGKFEVLDYLMVLRQTGDHGFYRYAEIHAGLRRRGVSLGYGGVWRTVNCLYSDGLLEVDFAVDGLQRAALFRAKILSVPVSSEKREHNILRVPDQNLCRNNKGGAVVAGRRSPGVLGGL